MDVSVLHLAGPAITLDLGATAQQMLWIIDVYGFMIAGLLVTMGSLGDRIGRRKLLLIGAASSSGQLQQFGRPQGLHSCGRSGLLDALK